MQTINETTIITRTELAGSEIDEELVFFNQTTGKYFATGKIGADIWAHLESPRSVSEICEYLLARYEVDRTTCEKQVHRFIGEMIDGGIVTSLQQTD